MQNDDRRLDNCIKCTDCNAACPVMKVLPEFPGPKALGPDLARMRKEGVTCHSPFLEYCLGCNRCEIACPNQVNVSELIARAKTHEPKSGRKAWRDYLLARPALLGKINSVMPRVTNSLLEMGACRNLLSKAMRISSRRTFPKYSSKAVRSHRNGASRPRAIFFQGCFIRYNNPELSQSVVDLLELYGCDVYIASEACCGVPALANGDGSEALNDVRKNVARLSPEAEQNIPIITACTSCGHMLKAEYPRLMSDDELGAMATKVAQNTYDLAEFLLERKAGRELRALKLRLAYHAPCHLKGQGIGRPWLELLRTVPGIEIHEIPAECCGMSGTFGFKEEKYEVSMKIGHELFEGISSYHPDLAVSECGTCRMQIEHGTNLRAVHPAEILHRALHS
jgi:glycerol-3-phosphate dehydrogenase subunit C